MCGCGLYDLEGGEVSLSKQNLPWEDSKKWRRGYWYPVPCRQDIEFEGDERTIEDAIWSLFRLDPNHLDPDDMMFGDIISMRISLTFLECVKLANDLNPSKIFTFSWAKELE